MLKKTGSSLLVVSYHSIFGSFKVAYVNQNTSVRKNKLLNIKRGEETIRLLEDYKPAQESRPVFNFKLPLDLIWNIFKNWQKILRILFGKVRVVLGMFF
ncbi:MAG: hypothetical protein ACOX50_00385 [Patescibacteria group bacterium]|jgi:hypothetical protein